MIDKFVRGIPQRLSKNHKSGQMLPILTAGVLIGISEIIFAISVGSLIFSGELAPNLAHGIGIALVTAMVTMISISLLSAIPGAIGSLQDSPSVILAITVAALVGMLSAAERENELNTILVLIAITSLLTGLLFLALGFFKLGGLVRFFPYPVIGGFLAGTGWLLVQGSFGTMTDYSLSLSNVRELLQPAQLLLWLPGAAFALISLISLRRIHHFLIMPIIMIGAIIMFYITLMLTGTSIEQAIQSGMLLGEIPGEIYWQPLSYKNLLAADWGAILRQSSNIATILILSLIGLLLNASALELALEKDADFNRELRTAGAANILSGLSGGMVGYHTLSASILSYKIGTQSRMVGLFAGLICALMLFAGSNLLTLFPKPILGGLLLFLGLEFLYEWVIRGWSKLSRVDYFVVILILIVIAATNFLVGVAVGLVATIILFVANYSRIKVVRHTMSGAEMKSNVERLDDQRRKLKELGVQIYILELQGFIFFGTANSLLEQVKVRLSDPNQLPVRFIILDFRHVSGIDSSAVYSFIKCRQIVKAQDIILILTNLSNGILHQLEVGGLLEDNTSVRVYPDLDRGLEWCEDHFLNELGIIDMTLPTTLPERLVEAGFLECDVDHLMRYLERVEVDESEYLIHQGDESNHMYFIESGHLSIYLEIENEKPLRLQTLGTRLVVGELGLYLGTTRSASIIADKPSITYMLSKAALIAMKQKAPNLAAALHEFVACELAERLADTTRLLSTLYT